MTERLALGAQAVAPPAAFSPRRFLLPLALAQFICSFAGSNMNVMINDISTDLDTTVQGVQTAITLFLLVMAALMIPGSKWSDRVGRKPLYLAGAVVTTLWAFPLFGLMDTKSPALIALAILGVLVLVALFYAQRIPSRQPGAPEAAT